MWLKVGKLVEYQYKREGGGGGNNPFISLVMFLH